MRESRQAPVLQQGFSLIEILIAVLVLSIGVLGLAGLQFVGLKEGQTSYQRSQATLLAYEMADRIRANRLGAAGGSYTVASGSTPSCSGLVLCGSDSGCSGFAQACTTAQMAAYDRYVWLTRIASQLPSGTGSIACTDTCGLGRKITVVVQWDELRNGAAGSGCSGTALAQDGCLAINIAP